MIVIPAVTVVLLLVGSVSSSELPVDSPDGVQELNGQLSESSHLWSDMIIFSSLLPSKSLSLNCILNFFVGFRPAYQVSFFHFCSRVW